MSNSCGAHTPTHEHTHRFVHSTYNSSQVAAWNVVRRLCYARKVPSNHPTVLLHQILFFSCSRPREIDTFLTTSIARMMSGKRMTRPSRQSGRLAQTPQPHPLSDAARTNDCSSAHQRIECIHGARASSRTSIPVGNRLGEPCGELLRPVECDYPALSFKNCGDVQIRDDPSLWQADSQATR